MSLILTVHDRVPLETCLETILGLADTAGSPVSREEIVQSVTAAFGGVLDRELLDRSLSLLVSRRVLRRLHVGPGHLAYAPHAAWGQRELELSDVLPPKPKARPHRQAKRLEDRRARALIALAGGAG